MNYVCCPSLHRTILSLGLLAVDPICFISLSYSCLVFCVSIMFVSVSLLSVFVSLSHFIAENRPPVVEDSTLLSAVVRPDTIIR